ncbi:sodium:calcium antiporter [Evansella cellulosilytica]|uniref:Sodium/calcium exchanger membrane region n=1 Tax=Evansella cellulosilytica (strain ATCC 21833 / DSM 2522 / FERM P-1141 / JCM 9156 / N-4) TaxID=649639 RepID=E6TX72_EVAC2|nr:sodium:calcium antiporter [Evansella cellulosilytica]ADU31161.1 sodium/calcium exchanger membrane region [Evansella cellulosilytica DSM 2522]
MMYLIFLLAATITVYSSIKLSTYADVLSERTSLGGMLVGTLLLAGATSLPEVTTSASAVFLNNPDIAVGNVLGSNLFNLLILATIDLIYRRRQMMTEIHKDHLFTGFISLGLTGLVLVTILVPTGITLFNIGIESYLLIIFYGISMRYVSGGNESTHVNSEVAATIPTEEVKKAHHTRAISLKKAKYGFAGFAFIIFITGSLLTISGDQIAQSTGISSSFVGSFLIAGATSLPELVTVLVAIQLLNYNLAIGNILGSNIFNLLILAFTDLLYREGSILAAANQVSAITALAVIVLNTIVLGAIILWQTKTKPKFSYPVPSILLILVYFVSSYLIFTLS